MRAGRLIAIVLLMQNNGKMTSKVLAEKLEVSERTIIRDMESLSEAGVPVYAERGLHGGWVLSEGYRTNLTGMHVDELVSVIVASQAALLGDLGIAKHYDAAVQKLLAASPTEVSRSAAIARQKIHIDGAGWHQMQESVPFLSVVQEAVWEERALQLRYQREDGIAERIVQPLGLVAKRSVWYVVGLAGGEMRTYRIARLLGAVMLEERIQRPTDFDLASYWEESMGDFRQRLPKYPATVLVTEASLTKLSKERYVKVLESSPSEEPNWITAKVEFQTLASACEIILSCGSRIAAIEPAELREKVKDEAKAMNALYS
ncbi:transcriptional regulator [Paenibacillus sp. FSL H8-0548]|uniref:helix-turn-helix transcriptional regulator n=1 Tax=Paenibacillus sp. FSL H8-0548 TaxID=1920422 RepID=UPI00096F00BE|nr:YafY family protein [Paenibacillus sp. FSL H8-0548]OMF22064.1 transcriptional regulator [Paenibacillus sp. FSL H8-0548]